MDYAPFGEELYSGLFMPSERFAQLTRDGEAGLDYAQARMYQPRTGRFGRPDQVFAGLFHPQGWNRYTYALANSVRFTDPSGWCSGELPCFRSGTVGTAPRDTEVEEVIGWLLAGSHGEGDLIGAIDDDFGGGWQGPQTGEESPPTRPTDDSGQQCDPITLEGCAPSDAGARIGGFVKGVAGTFNALFSSSGPERA
jgi:RHS repeat-associated protein